MLLNMSVSLSGLGIPFEINYIKFGAYWVLRMATGMDNTIKIKIEIIYLRIGMIFSLEFLYLRIISIDDNLRAFSYQPSEKYWHSHFFLILNKLIINYCFLLIIL